MNKSNARVKLKYLFTGSLLEYGTCEARRSGLIEMGRNVESLSYEPFFEYPKFLGPFGRKMYSLQTLAGIGSGITDYGHRLLAISRQCKPDVIWIEKGHFVSRALLREIKRHTNALLVCYNTDDIRYARNGWRLHLPSIPEYDIYFTTNQFNVPELKAAGARQVVLTQMGYNRNLFTLRQVAAEDALRLGGDVGFIGHWEQATEEIILKLAANRVGIRVRGASWTKMKNKKMLKAIVEPHALSIEDYTKAIISTKINLGINSTQSRNLSSGRTFEIPAAGGFLLGQRTSEHQSFYVEGKEAEFFDSAEELAEKISYYLEHDAERQSIALAGHQRCVSSGYSWQELMVGLVSIIEGAIAKSS